MCAYAHQKQFQNAQRSRKENNPKLETTRMPTGNEMNEQASYSILTQKILCSHENDHSAPLHNRVVTLTNIILSETTQTHKSVYCIIPVI